MDRPTTVIDAAHPRFRKPKFDMIAGIRLAMVQLAVSADKCKNLERAVKEICEAKEKGAEIVSLPECFNSPYGTKYFPEYAEEIPYGPTSEALSKVAAEVGVYVIGGTFPEKKDGKLYNTCTVWNNCGELVGIYRKMHLFDIDIPGQITFKESDVLAPGNDITIINYKNIKIGLGICYDIRFSELAKVYQEKGCSLLVYPGAFNMTTGPKHWELLARSRAVDMQLFVAMISPARDEDASYIAWGHTMLVNPWGEVQTLKYEPGTLITDIDLKVMEEVRAQIPVIKQKRLDLYETIWKKCK